MLARIDSVDAQIAGLTAACWDEDLAHTDLRGHVAAGLGDPGSVLIGPILRSRTRATLRCR